MVPVTNLPRDRSRSRLRPATIKVMSFNIRFDTVADTAMGNDWAARVDSVIETVERFDPDIVGFQEVLHSQLYDLVAALPDHDVVGRPREAGPGGEHVPIFFDRDRFDGAGSGDFWLSPTPEVAGSIGWDAANPRHCTWLRLLDRSSGLRFAVFNTHLDNRGAMARLEAARIIVADATVAPGLPSIILGDFNAEERSGPLDTLREAGLIDTFRNAHPNERDVQTAHHYVGLSGGAKIEYIMCDRHWEVIDAGIVRAPAAGRLPSDHFPVIAELRCTAPKTQSGS
jgi:endonuclease/exonuclease/phosphatase family metal-dependent hydrolase